MKSFFGRINTDRKKIDHALLETGLSELSCPSDSFSDIKINENFGFGYISFDSNSDILSSNDQVIILADCRLDNRMELIEILNIPNTDTSDDLIILSAFKKWSHNCVNYFLGDFAFAIWDSNSNELFCARDHFGLKPFFYFFDGVHFVFSSEINAILTQTDLNFSIDQQYIADTLSIVKSEKFRTTYSEIKKLTPANFLVFKKNHLELTEYWTLKLQQTESSSDDVIIEGFKKLLYEAVACRIPQNVSVGVELSGGIDSSSITAIASEFTNVKTFSHVLQNELKGKMYPFKDESNFIGHVTDYLNIKHTFFITSEATGIVDAIEKTILTSKSINQQNFGAFSDHLYLKASHEGISILLSGFGGDEVITSKSEGYLEDLAVSGLWKELQIDLKNQNLNQFHFIKSYLKLLLKAKAPTLLNLILSVKMSKPWWYMKFDRLALNKLFSEKMKVENRYFAQFENTKYLHLQEKNIERITHPHVSQRLEYCALAARKSGIEYRYPFFDKRLIEYYLSMPARLKARNGILRFAIREALKGILPEQIRTRNDKSGATIPSVFMRTMKDKDEIANIIRRSKSNLIVQRYIDVDAYEKWFHEFCERNNVSSKYSNPGAFYNYLKLILFIEHNQSFFE